MCAEGLDFNRFAGLQPYGWVLGSCGMTCHNSPNYSYSPYASAFGKGTRISVHLNMNERTCAFSINGTKYGNVSTWTNLPEHLYPVVSIVSPGKVRIQPYKKTNY